MVKQLGIPAYFLILSCAYLRWSELPHVINKSNNLNLSDENITNLTYQQRTKMLNDNPVLVASHFQYKVQVLSKETILEGPLGKAKYYVQCIEFQEIANPHVHASVWIFNAPRMSNETEFNYFVERNIFLWPFLFR